jgi:hypothetical protein
MHFADFVVDAGIEQDALGGRGLAGVDVSADADVAVTLDGGLAGHHNLLGICWNSQMRQCTEFKS